MPQGKKDRAYSLSTVLWQTSSCRINEALSRGDSVVSAVANPAADVQQLRREYAALPTPECVEDTRRFVRSVETAIMDLTLKGVPRSRRSPPEDECDNSNVATVGEEEEEAQDMGGWDDLGSDYELDDTDPEETLLNFKYFPSVHSLQLMLVAYVTNPRNPKSTREIGHPFWHFQQIV